ncbi:inactive rhomboid protein 2 [Clonorchis sinensis]|uniref:Inactive rhomboid protein 2 n=1 Tax=Clonorchis sinensis TaxID=79923 RepID=G7Y9S3_CLOSI|nr:inactive rhomboid protein 2 [Clonorchis sinensis]
MKCQDKQLHRSLVSTPRDRSKHNINAARGNRYTGYALFLINNDAGKPIVYLVGLEYTLRLYVMTRLSAEQCICEKLAVKVYHSITEGPSSRVSITCTSVSCSRAFILENPYFTLSVSAIQVVVFLVHWGIYGFSPVGVSVISHHMATVALPNGTSGRVCWVEPENSFIGPRQVDLIRAGARYPPCMRFDSQLHSTVIQRQRSFDRLSGCCLNRATRSCHQTSHTACSTPTYDWLTYSDLEPAPPHSPSEESDSLVTHTSLMDTVKKSNTSVVCGLDPNYCLKPRSSPSLPWPDDISEWPVCENVANTSSEIDPSPLHMQCQVIGRPCCFGILGECVVTTEEHCKFMHGSYHSKAAVCSQVNCLKDICGMAPFLKGDYADQWYRLITSLFIHSGAKGNLFDERQLFAGQTEEAKTLKHQMREHFYNISRIMDCVGCDKCRLWGKLQRIANLRVANNEIAWDIHIETDNIFQWSAVVLQFRSPETCTAYRIYITKIDWILLEKWSLEYHLDFNSETFFDPIAFNPDFQLSRREIVALFNAFSRAPGCAQNSVTVPSSNIGTSPPSTTEIQREMPILKRDKAAGTDGLQRLTHPHSSKKVSGSC